MIWNIKKETAEIVSQQPIIIISILILICFIKSNEAMALNVFDQFKQLLIGVGCNEFLSLAINCR